MSQNIRPIVSVSGHIAEDASIKTFEDSRTVVNCRIGCNFSYTNKQSEKVRKTQWIKLANISDKMVPYLKKGTHIFVQGILQEPETYIKDDKAYATDVVRVESLTFLDNKED